MYKIDNKYQKAKIKNLEQRLDFQKYNIKEKKKKNKIQKTKQNKKNKATRIIKKQQLPQKSVYTAFALKIGSFFFEK